MRIMFAVPTYWPSQDGVANITGYLARGLAGRGHELFVLTNSGDSGLLELPERERHENVEIVRMRIETKWPLVLRGRDEKSSPESYLRHIKDCQPDVLVVVCSQIWTLDWLIPYLDEITCVKVFYSHGYSKWQEKYDYAGQLKNRNILGAWILYRCKKYYDNLYKTIRKFDLAIYLSKQSNSVRYAEKYDLQNGEILENAIDDIFFDSGMRHEYPRNEKRPLTYLFVANYNGNKNQEMLLRAFADADIGKAKLVLAGYEENEYYHKLEDISRERLMTQADKEVLLLTHLEREEVIDLYRTCDIFVCSSLSETWSIVAHEAAAAAMPIISTDVGVYGDIDGVYLVGGQEEMKRAMEELFYSEAERERRGNDAYEWVIKRNCRISDKVDWLDEKLCELIRMRENA